MQQRTSDRYYTDKELYIPPAIKKKLDLMARRCSGKKNFQNVIITDGKEGYGKSTLTAINAYYMGWVLKREIVLFFDIEKLINYAIRHEDKIIIWDDAAFAALSMEAYNKIIIKLVKLLFLARKKRHTYFINIQELFKLKEPIVTRAISLFHVYSPDNIELGYYLYYGERNTDFLYTEWRKSGYKNYKQHYLLNGRFNNDFNKIVPEDDYDALKDYAILSIGDERKDSGLDKLNELKHKIATLADEFKELTQEKLAKHFKTTRRSIVNWKAYVFNDVDENNLDLKTRIEKERKKIISTGYITITPGR